ncbi:MAG TPA: hypothetical protein VIY48_08780, partial [Candidatus Paceibacterota bacterium]
QYSYTTRWGHPRTRPTPTHIRRTVRQASAKRRQAYRNQRTAAQQIYMLDSRGFAAKRERARLAKGPT